MSEGWFGKFIDNLAGLLKEPPYLIFLFIGTIFVVVSLLSEKHFEQVWIFFFYSVVGTIWRYIERDLVGNSFTEGMKSTTKYKRTVIIIYHIVNTLLILILFRYLGF